MGCTVTSDLFPPPNERDREHLDLMKPLDLISSLNFSYHSHLFCVYMGVGANVDVRMSRHACGGQRAIFGSQLSPSVM